VSESKRTRRFRGQERDIVRTTKNVITGAVYDLIEYPRTVTSKRDGSTTTVYLNRKLRRPGTGLPVAVKEIEVETEIEAGAE
jgi:hypothetical protein